MSDAAKIRTEESQRRRDFARADKMSRILAASSFLFSEQGFEKTTIQQIAARAGVAAGTVFLYVEDKGELLLLLYQNAVEEILPIAIREITGHKELGVEIVDFFSHFFKLYFDDLKLGRVIFREILFPEGLAGERLETQRNKILQILERRISRDLGPLEARQSTRVAGLAVQIYALYQATLSLTLSDRSSEADPAALFKSLLKNQIKGFATPQVEMVKVQKRLKFFRKVVLFAEEQSRQPVM